MAELAGTIVGVVGLIQTTGEYVMLGSRRSRHLKLFEELHSQLESFAMVLSMLNDYSESVSHMSSGPLMVCLHACTEDMTILRDTMKSILRPTNWLGRILPDKLSSNEVSACLSRIQAHKATITLVLNQVQLQQAGEMKERMMGIERMEERMADVSLRESQEKLLNWLFPGPFNGVHVEISQRRVEGTGKWFLETPEFQEWTSGREGTQLLWGYGIPGAGKTFLSSLVVDHLREREGWAVIYIYFDHTDQLQQRPIRVLGSLVKQLASQSGYQQRELEGLYEKLQGGDPTLDQLYAILFMATSVFSQTFAIFDALDECDKNIQRKYFLPLFHRMANDGVKLFLTSREHPEDIQDSFKNFRKVKLYARDEDIASYIIQKIEENPRAKRLFEQGNCKDRAISVLISCAGGMFLFVRFHIENLCQQTTLRQILVELERLQSFSRSEGPLRPTYDRALETLRGQPTSCLELASKILSWLVKARRLPTVCELQMAVSVEQDDLIFNAHDLPDKKTLLDVCAGFATVDKNTDTIRLIHYTTMEYLLGSSIIPGDANFNLTIACITFASFDVFSQGACDSDDSLDARFSLYPFLKYVAQYLHHHLKECDETLSAGLLLRLLGRPGCVQSYLQAFHSLEFSEASESSRFSRYPKGQSPLHVAAALGHRPVVGILLEDADIMAVDNLGRTALHIAAYEGHDALVRLLLEKGADPRATDNDGATALKLAANKGHALVARLLLEQKTNLTFTNYNRIAEAASKQSDIGVSKLDRYKLETAFYEDHVVHTTSKTDRAAGQRKTEVKTKWKRKKEIGVGGFGVVWLEEEDEGELRAVKRLPLRCRNVDYSSELSTMAKLTDHAYLFAQFLGWYEDKDFLYIAMEYVEYGDLSQYIKDPNIRLHAREVTSQILEGLAVLHERHICHRDLKPQNILVACLDPIWVKIADFGVSKREKGTGLHTNLGTSGYVAPEILGLVPQRFRIGGSYTNAVDLWSLGCLIHEILTSEIPFLEPLSITITYSTPGNFSEESTLPITDIKHLLDYCHGSREFPMESLKRSHVSDEGIDFVKRLLAADPSSRLTAKEALEDKWLLERNQEGAARENIEIGLPVPAMTSPGGEGNLQKTRDSSGTGIHVTNSTTPRHSMLLDDFEAIPDMSPPLDTLPHSKNLSVTAEGPILDLSSDPHANLLHPAELHLASRLYLSCALYLTYKRRIFQMKVEREINGLGFTETDSYKACKMDINRASELWNAYEKFGWFDKQHFQQYL